MVPVSSNQKCLTSGGFAAGPQSSPFLLTGAPLKTVTVHVQRVLAVSQALLKALEALLHLMLTKQRSEVAPVTNSYPRR